MEEIKEILRQIIANQVVLYKRIEQVESKIKGGLRSAGDESYVSELKKEAEKFIKYIKE